MSADADKIAAAAGLEYAVEYAAKALPIGQEVNICVEQGSAYVMAYNEQGLSYMFEDLVDASLAEQVIDVVRQILEGCPHS